MKISYNWLLEFVKTRLSATELAAALTGVGLAVDAVHAYGDDFILDFDLTSNRPDCLSHFGIAREVSVIERSGPPALPAHSFPAKGNTRDLTSVEIYDPDLCPRYSAQIVKGVKIGPSPDWLVRRLEAIGQRAINNVADITNYVLHELGHPLHAFDLAKLHEQRIVVRRARKGERLRTLDGVERELDEGVLVIADADRPVAVAGVLGGEDSEISADTSDVLIESAYFSPGSIRRTSKQLGLRTEASHRFERGTDPEGVLAAQARCAALICEFAGGTATCDPLDVYPEPIPLREATIRPNRVYDLAAQSVSVAEIERILGALGFKLRARHAGAETEANVVGDVIEDFHFHSRESLSFIVPSWRADVEIEEDLIEEVARHVGFEGIDAVLPPTNLAGEYRPSERRRRALRSSLTHLGFDESINFSFIDALNDGRFELLPEIANSGAKNGSFVALSNPIIEGVTRMRPTLLAGLLQSIRHNFNHGNRDVRLFELGHVFSQDEVRGELPKELESFALALTGRAVEEGRVGTQRELDFYDLKGAIEAASDAVGVSHLRCQATSARHLREGQAAAIFSDEIQVGTAGRLADVTASFYKFRQPVFVAELDLTSLLSVTQDAIRYSPVARFPSIVRDISLLIDRNVTLNEVLDEIASLRLEECRRAAFVDVYEGANLQEGQKSLTVRLEYRAEDRTLRDDEVEAIHRRVVSALERQFGTQPPV